MKLKIKYLTFIGLTLFLFSCEDFLDHPITDSVSDANIGAVLADNPDQIESFLGNAYRSIGGINLYGRMMYYSFPEMAHEVDMNYTADLGWNEFSQNDMTSTNSYVELYYTYFYEVISTSNLTVDLLDKMDMSELDSSIAEKMTNYKGEALFLRAFCHLTLLEMFGEKGPSFGGGYPNNKDDKGIVLMLKTATADNALTARSTVGECYDAILADLKASEELIGDNQIPSNDVARTPGSSDIDYTKDVGWAQMPAVHALLGKVYLYMNDYENAKTEFESVISDSRFKLDRPVNFTDYIQHSDNNSESVFFAAIL